MAKEKIKTPTFDEIVFEFRNKEYGSFSLRRKYNQYMTISLLIGIFIICTALITPYLRTKAAVARGVERQDREVIVEMENLEMPSEEFAPPPPPPPPPPDEGVQQTRYVPPVVVDELDEEEEVGFMIATDVAEVVQDLDVNVVIEVVTNTQTIEVEDVANEIPQFVVVEEMPMFPGGETELLRYVQSNVVYPERAKENNIQGRVYAQFVVTSRGTIGEVRILRGVDAEIDAEVIRVIRTLPAFRPGRQGGVSVPVWYQIPVTFQLR